MITALNRRSVLVACVVALCWGAWHCRSTKDVGRAPSKARASIATVATSPTAQPRPPAPAGGHGDASAVPGGKDAN
jgi:hypothetical protein